MSRRIFAGTNEIRYIYSADGRKLAQKVGSSLTYYNPMLGRWFNQDPAHQFANPYSYCANSPAMYQDPDGRQTDGYDDFGDDYDYDFYYLYYDDCACHQKIVSSSSYPENMPYNSLNVDSYHSPLSLPTNFSVSGAGSGVIYGQGKTWSQTELGMMLNDAWAWSGWGQRSFWLGMIPMRGFSIDANEAWSSRNYSRYGLDMVAGTVEGLFWVLTFWNPGRTAAPEVQAALRGGVNYFSRPAAGVIREASQATNEVAKVGNTVLGKYPEYINLAEELGARRFNIPTYIWNNMTPAEQWAANLKFLDRAIARGDNFILSNRVMDINKVTGVFRQELDYLISKGYRLSPDGLQIIK